MFSFPAIFTSKNQAERDEMTSSITWSANRVTSATNLGQFLVFLNRNKSHVHQVLLQDSTHPRIN